MSWIEPIWGPHMRRDKCLGLKCLSFHADLWLASSLFLFVMFVVIIFIQSKEIITKHVCVCVCVFNNKKDKILVDFTHIYMLAAQCTVKNDYFFNFLKNPNLNLTIKCKFFPKKEEVKWQWGCSHSWYVDDNIGWVHDI